MVSHWKPCDAPPTPTPPHVVPSPLGLWSCCSTSWSSFLHLVQVSLYSSFWNKSQFPEPSLKSLTGLSRLCTHNFPGWRLGRLPLHSAHSMDRLLSSCAEENVSAASGGGWLQGLPFIPQSGTQQTTRSFTKLHCPAVMTTAPWLWLKMISSGRTSILYKSGQVIKSGCQVSLLLGYFFHYRNLDRKCVFVSLLSGGKLSNSFLT